MFEKIYRADRMNFPKAEQRNVHLCCGLSENHWVVQDLLASTNYTKTDKTAAIMVDK